MIRILGVWILVSFVIGFLVVAFRDATTLAFWLWHLEMPQIGTDGS